MKNWFNEFYAKNTSRKIRAVQKSKGEQGLPLTTNIPYGYKRDPENPKHWIIDPEAAEVVKRIFDMCMQGRGPSQIAKQLEKDKVLTPTAYRISLGINTPHAAPEKPYHWNSSTVVNMLELREYTGCTVNFKTYTNSLWDKKQRENPVEKQAIFPDTHERIIEDEVFEKVQEIRQQRHRQTRTGRSSMFSGLVFCSDCGAKMFFCSTNNYKESGAFFECSEHWKNREEWRAHFIREAVLEKLVLKHIQAVTGYILRYEEHFRRTMLEKQLVEGQTVIQGLKKQLERDEKRISELKRLFMKIYEDNANGWLNDERYYLLSQNYEKEQKELEAEAVSLRNQIEQQERHTEEIEKFIQLAKQHVGIEKLDAYVLHELIQGIYVDAPEKSSGKRHQHIHIKYDGVGFIPLDMLMKEETA